MATGLPYGSISIFGLTFLVEAIDLCDLSGFVIATNEGYSVGISGERRLISPVRVFEPRSTTSEACVLRGGRGGDLAN